MITANRFLAGIVFLLTLIGCGKSPREDELSRKYSVQALYDSRGSTHGPDWQIQHAKKSIEESQEKINFFNDKDRILDELRRSIHTGSSVGLVTQRDVYKSKSNGLLLLNSNDVEYQVDLKIRPEECIFVFYWHGETIKLPVYTFGIEEFRKSGNTLHFSGPHLDLTFSQVTKLRFNWMETSDHTRIGGRRHTDPWQYSSNEPIFLDFPSPDDIKFIKFPTEGISDFDYNYLTTNYNSVTLSLKNGDSVTIYDKGKLRFTVAGTTREYDFKKILNAKSVPGTKDVFDITLRNGESYQALLNRYMGDVYDGGVTQLSAIVFGED